MYRKGKNWVKGMQTKPLQFGTATRSTTPTIDIYIILFVNPVKVGLVSALV